MKLEGLSTLASRIEWSESTGSTNTDLVAAVTTSPDLWPDFSVLGTDFQEAGRGRSGRSWQAPAGSSIFVSVLLRPDKNPSVGFGWLPLMAGLAVRDAVDGFGAASGFTVKWPNDVLVGGRKIAGVLSEFVPAANAVVIGVGINLLQSAEQLPIEQATSLALEGATGFSPESVLSAYLERLRNEYDAFVACEFDAERSGLRARASANCGTLGREVRAILPGENEIEGTAVEIDATGRLVIRALVDGQLHSVAAGDIVHLRH